MMDYNRPMQTETEALNGLTACVGSGDSGQRERFGFSGGGEGGAYSSRRR